MTGAGDAIFDWDVATPSHASARPRISWARSAARSRPAAGWLDVLHPLDRDRYTLALDGLLHSTRGASSTTFACAAGRPLFLVLLKARPVVGADGDVMRVIGTLADVTETKAAEERMLHDAIHDNLTGLPNRELFFDRLESAVALARRPGANPDRSCWSRYRPVDGGQCFVWSFLRRFGSSGHTARRFARHEVRATRWPGLPATSSAPSFSTNRSSTNCDQDEPVAGGWPRPLCALAQDIP